MGTRDLSGKALVFFCFWFSYFWDRFRTKCRAQLGSVDRLRVFFSSHFAFMSDRGRLAVLSLYVLGPLVIINQAENRGGNPTTWGYFWGYMYIEPIIKPNIYSVLGIQCESLCRHHGDPCHS